MPMTMPSTMPIRPSETLMRKSDLIMILSFDFLANDFVAKRGQQCCVAQ
jgi:hypothetical protein